jgi:nickel-dependent lactate racemase
VTRRTVQLAYGRHGLAIDVPAERTTVITPTHRPGVEDPGATLRTALREPVAGPPLHAILRPGQTVAVSVCDVTRPQPRRPMLEAIFEACDGVIRPEDVVILVATGTHRSSTKDERIAMFGADIVETFRVVDHDARDRSSLVDLGMVGDVPVLLNREWVEADIRITTGFVEPHFFAGFSGGPKMVAPGLAGLATVLALHDARRIGDPRATFGVIEGNPVHDAVRAIAAATGVHFALDVLLNDQQRITRAFGGELFAMHAVAREAARAEAMQPVERPFDIGVTTNSGYPLDQNLYQAVKGMAAAALVTRPGGPIICAAACEDGLPDHGSYARLLASASTPQGLLDMIAAHPETVPDQWQVQVQARIQVEHEVFVHADGLSDVAIRAAHFTPSDDVAETLARLLRDDPDATLGVLPEGPQTIAYVA